MAHDPRVTAVLSRLGGVYRDPARVDRDAAALLASGVGAHLAPTSCLLDGAHVLTLQGTIAIHFKGATYQLLVDMFLPPRYPQQPPACFVRLASPTMYLKPNHKHVDSAGRVYLPYLHEWSRSTHTLVELVVVMSSVFSNEPPVFTRAAGAAAAAAPTGSLTSSVSSTAGQPLPPPAIPASASWTPAPPPPASATANDADADARDPALQAALAESRAAAEQAARRAAEERAAAEEAAAARRAEAESRAAAERRRADLAAAQQRERGVRARSQLDDRVRRYLLQQAAELQLQRQTDARDAQRLEWAGEHKIGRPIQQLSQAKAELTQHLAATDQCLEDIQDWLAEAEARAAAAAGATAASQKVVVVPVSPQDAQLLDLEATNASLTDALYFLDRALHEGLLDCEQHLRQVRQCAKQQFLVRAHLLKIQQARHGPPDGSR